ncbi:hypothetical protein ACHAWF_005216, partial [Thalassiosira exigua]
WRLLFAHTSRRRRRCGACAPSTKKACTNANDDNDTWHWHRLALPLLTGAGAGESRAVGRILLHPLRHRSIASSTIMGKLEGITLTPELRFVAEAALSLPQPDRSDENAAAGEGADSSASSSSSSPRSMSSSSPAAILEEVRRAKRALSRPPFAAAKQAKEALEVATEKGATVLPLEGVEATKFLVARSSSDPAYEKRLERLRLLDEERSYRKYTTNLDGASKRKDDDITARSMTYATSVGLNMIVAPLSFGAFMYFFAGSIFARFFDDGEDLGGGSSGVDVRRVIAGVVSGVFMLFVEMILFVIRSHELDASVRKKGRRKENRANPFGYTTKSMERVYVAED